MTCNLLSFELRQAAAIVPVLKSVGDVVAVKGEWSRKRNIARSNHRISCPSTLPLRDSGREKEEEEEEAGVWQDEEEEEFVDVEILPVRCYGLFISSLLSCAGEI